MSSVNLSPALAGLLRQFLLFLSVAVLLLPAGCANQSASDGADANAASGSPVHAGKPKSYGKFKEMAARLELCPERWITVEGISDLGLYSQAKEAWYAHKDSTRDAYTPFRQSRARYLSQYFPATRLAFESPQQVGMSGRLCSITLLKSAARGRYDSWWYWSGLASPDDLITSRDFSYWPASRSGDISGLIDFLAEYYQGQMLLRGNVYEAGKPGHGALITFPDSVGYVYVRFLEFHHAGRVKKHDSVLIDIFIPGKEYVPGLRRMNEQQLKAFYKELREMAGTSTIRDPYQAREIERKRLARLHESGTATMGPWPDDLSGFMLSELGKLFIGDRTQVDLQVAARNAAQKAESDRWQAEAEGNSYREALSGALAEVVQEHADLYGGMQQQTQQAVGNVVSMSGGGSYQSPVSPQITREQREKAEREAMDESRRARYGTKQAELKRCQAIGGRWGGGSPDFLLDGFCDETVIRPAAATVAKSSESSATCDTASGNQVRVYSREKQQEVCVTLGPVQPEAMAYCWDVNFRDGYLHAYTEEKNRRYLCDGPIQKLSVSVPTVREALSMTGCNLDTVRDRAQLDRIHGDYWFHCGYGLAGPERDVWMLRKKTNARPGALEYRCREDAPSPCRVLNDSAREGLLD